MKKLTLKLQQSEKRLNNEKLFCGYRYQYLSFCNVQKPSSAPSEIIKLVGEVIDNAEDTTISLIAPPQDQAFYKVVMEKRKTNEAYLITGNLKHFPIEPFILSPRNMLNLVMNYPIQ